MTPSDISASIKCVPAGPRSSLRWRAAALVEVLLAFGLVHLCWRSFKHFTTAGRLESRALLNLSPGLIMIGFTVLAVRARGWRLSRFGLNLRHWRYHLNLGIVCGLLSTLALAGVVLLTGYRPAGWGPPTLPWHVAAVGFGFAFAFAILLIALLRRKRRVFRIIPPAVSIPLLLFLWSLPVLGASQPASHLVQFGIVVSMVVRAGLGEEVFFRGYVQTRVNLAFGRPLCVAGCRFGVGIVISLLLFGLVHALNTVDYFHGPVRFQLAAGSRGGGGRLLLRHHPRTNPQRLPRSHRARHRGRAPSRGPIVRTSFAQGAGKYLFIASART